MLHLGVTHALKQLSNVAREKALLFRLQALRKTQACQALRLYLSLNIFVQSIHGKAPVAGSCSWCFGDISCFPQEPMLCQAHAGSCPFGDHKKYTLQA